LDNTESQSLADVLHDDVLQHFAACQMMIQLCRRHITSGRIAEAEQDLAQMDISIEGAIAGVRRVISTIKNP
jgi:signal transduction histidine kinase